MDWNADSDSWSLQGSMAYYGSSYELPLTIRNVFGIVCVKLWTFCWKHHMFSIKFNLAIPFSLLKLAQSLLHSLASLFDSLLFFWLVFCTFVCLIFLSFILSTVRKVSKYGVFSGLYLGTFHAVLFIASVFIVYMTKVIACI